MKGFGIYVKNNLLEPKHIENMDAAVWLYLWLLDKMTSVNENGVGKVLGSQPIQYSQIKSELGLSERTYRRWVDKLRATGYIQTIRTPYGLIITVNKAEKIFKRYAKNGTTKKLNSDVPNVAEPDVPNLSRDMPNSPPVRPKMAHVIKTIQDNTIDNTSITNVIPEKPVYGKPEINNLFEFWEQEVGYPIKTQVQKNRNACNTLIKSHGVETVKRFITWVNLAHADRYATKNAKAADFVDLQHNLKHLLVWAKGKANAQSAVAKF